MDSLESLPCTLSASEKARKADELCREVQHHSALEREKSLVSKALADQIKASDRKIADLAEQIRTGVETRDVKCSTEKDFMHNVVHTKRLDTREIVSSRPMQAGERQAELFAKPGKQLPLTEKFDELGTRYVETVDAPDAGPGEDDDEAAESAGH